MERVASLVKPTSMVLRTRNRSQQVAPSQDTHHTQPLPISQDLILDKLPGAGAEHPAQIAKRSKKDCEDIMKVTHQGKESRCLVKKSESATASNSGKSRVTSDRFTLKKKTKKVH